ncbi:MAG: hypothetical protein LBB65_02545 [Burkholderiales bacterium]|nr:hypothetical protein [Burkholderiales bacterium]
MAIVCAMIIVAIFVLPYLTVKMTLPGWWIIKFFLIFVVLLMVLSLFLPKFVSISAASAIAIIFLLKRER